MGNVTGREEEEGEEEVEEEENGGGDDEDPSARSSERGFAPYHARRAHSVESIGGGGGGGGGESPPQSPRRSPSPFMFAPQIPVPPLQRYADTPQLFNQLSTNKQLGSFNYPPEKKIPVLLVWTLGGKTVHVEGSWDNWATSLSLERSGKDHSVLMSLPSGIYRYRFVVDGERRFIPDFPCITDEMGNTVNLLDVRDYVPDNVAGVSEFDRPPSPDSSYSWQEPSDQDFAKEPPALPAQLHLTVLDLENSEAATVKPHHVLLNHLFIEKPGGPQPLVGLGFTHRFQSKYVTVVLYKPME